MWQLEYPWWEMVLRAGAVYVGVFFLFRVIGKKQLGEMSPFDFVLLLIVSESVNGALIGKDNSILGGFISAVTLVGLSYVIDVFAFKSKKFEKFIEGEPKFIIVKGKVCEDVRAKAKITHDELKSALRESSIDDFSEVKYAVLENNGKISVIKDKHEELQKEKF